LAASKLLFSFVDGASKVKMEIPSPPNQIINQIIDPSIYEESVIEQTCNLEMVEMFGTSNCRSFKQPQCCGAHVRLGDLVKMKRTVVMVSRSCIERDEDAIAIVRIEDGAL
jgi:heterodisulfide reductase subunit B